MDSAKKDDGNTGQPITVRRRTTRGLPDVGLILPDKPNEVVKINVWQLPMTVDEFAKQPRETFNTTGELMAAGWTQD